jgi:site-specific DNA recombinase
MKAVVYTRVSQDQSGGRSVTEQEAECRAICERNGWDVTHVFTDNDRSASRYATRTRPAFDQLREHLQHQACDVLVTWEASRSTRDLATYVELRDLCRERGVRWSYSGRLYDLTDDVDQFGTGLDALLAEQESARTRKRVLRSVRANAAAGRPHGKNSYGYRRTYDATTRQLLTVEIVQEHAAVLREVADRVLAGESIFMLARELNDRGVPAPSGGTWWGTNLSRLMRNPAFNGKRVLNGETVADAIWPPIFDDDTWTRLQALLADPARTTARNRRDLKHLLTGIALCGFEGCDATMKLLKNRTSLSYMCSKKFHVSRKQDDVDRVVIAALFEMLRRTDRGPAFGPDGADAEARIALDKADSERARLETFYDSAARGELSAAALARIEARMLADIKALELSARRASFPAMLREIDGDDIPAQWDTYAPRIQRALVRHYLTVRILPVGQGRRKFDPASVLITWN